MIFRRQWRICLPNFPSQTSFNNMICFHLMSNLIKIKQFCSAWLTCWRGIIKLGILVFDVVSWVAVINHVRKCRITTSAAFVVWTNKRGKFYLDASRFGVCFLINCLCWIICILLSSVCRITTLSTCWFLPEITFLLLRMGIYAKL